MGDGQENMKFMKGYFIVFGSVGTNLAHIMDPIQRGTSESESVDTILRGQITEEQLVILLRNTIQAIGFLHSANVVHRNICPQHILVDENFFDVRICGFGHCRTLPEENIKKGSGNSRRIREALRENPDIFNNEKDLRKQIARKLHKRREGLAEKKRMLSCDFGQRFYRAPEVLQMSRHYDFAVDVWSLGLTMAEAAKAFNLEANFPIFFDEAAFLFNKKVRKENLPLYQGISAHPISPRSVNNDEKRDKKEVTKINHQDQLAVILADMHGELRPDIDLSFLFDQDEFNRAIKLRKELNISEQKG